MSTTDTAPAAETEIAERPTATEHDAATHQPIPQVGEDEAPAPAASAAPAPVSPPPPPAAPAAQAETDPATDPKAPKWYRDHMAKTNRELAAQRAENERLRSQGPPSAPRPAAPAAQLPNPAEDPQGYHDAIAANYRRDMQQFQLQQTLTISERFARQQHGAEAFEDCRAWLSTKPDIENWAIQQPDPWTAAFTQYNRERLAEEIGDDPNAWREKERQRLRDEILAEQAGSAHADTRPAPQMRPAPPAPASTARAAAPRDGGGRFTGPAPLGSLSKNKFD